MLGLGLERNKGGAISRAPNHYGGGEWLREAPKTRNNVTSTFVNAWIYVYFRRTSGANMGRQSCFLPRSRLSSLRPWSWVIFGEDDRCLHVALPVATFHCLKCSLKLSLREQPLLPVVDVFSAGWVGKALFQGTVASLLPKMTQEPAYCSWTPRAHHKQDQRYWAASRQEPTRTSIHHHPRPTGDQSWAVTSYNSELIFQER